MSDIIDLLRLSPTSWCHLSDCWRVAWPVATNEGLSILKLDRRVAIY